MSDFVAVRNKVPKAHGNAHDRLTFLSAIDRYASRFSITLDHLGIDRSRVPNDLIKIQACGLALQDPQVVFQSKAICLAGSRHQVRDVDDLCRRGINGRDHPRNQEIGHDVCVKGSGANANQIGGPK